MDTHKTVEYLTKKFSAQSVSLPLKMADVIERTTSQKNALRRWGEAEFMIRWASGEEHRCTQQRARESVLAYLKKVSRTKKLLLERKDINTATSGATPAYLCVHIGGNCVHKNCRYRTRALCCFPRDGTCTPEMDVARKASMSSWDTTPMSACVLIFRTVGRGILPMRT